MKYLKPKKPFALSRRSRTKRGEHLSRIYRVSIASIVKVKDEEYKQWLALRRAILAENKKMTE